MNGRWIRRARRRALLLLIAPLCLAGQVAAQVVAQDPPAGGFGLIQVLPVDEAVQDPAFFAFRARLQRAVAERDTSALLAIVDPDIRLSFGGDGGLADFRAMWLEDPDAALGDSTAALPDRPGIWAELGTVLALGGRFWDGSTFVAPYTFSAFGPDPTPEGYDGFISLFVIDDAVPVRAAPAADADTLASSPSRSCSTNGGRRWPIPRPGGRRSVSPPMPPSCSTLRNRRRSASSARPRCGAASTTARSSGGSTGDGG